VCGRAVDLLRAGDARALGALMAEAQARFDRDMAPACPEQLTMPLLHALLGGLDGHRASRFVLDAVGEMSDDRFLERYGHLGARVMDVAAPRFDEQPDQLHALRRALPEASRIEADRARAAQARKLAVSTLASELTGPIDRARFLAATEVVQSLGGLSDWALEALSICLAHCRRALLAVVEAADVPEGLQWSDMRLEQIEALRTGRSIPEAVDGPLPGRPLQSGSSRPDSGLVGGIATGTLTHPDADSPPERPIWLLDSVGLAAIPPIASGVGAVVTAPVARGGPAVLVAAMLGRPCVSVSSAASLVPGVRVTVDGERGTVVSAS